MLRIEIHNVEQIRASSVIEDITKICVQQPESWLRQVRIDFCRSGSYIILANSELAEGPGLLRLVSDDYEQLEKAVALLASHFSHFDLECIELACGMPANTQRQTKLRRSKQKLVA